MPGFTSMVPVDIMNGGNGAVDDCLSCRWLPIIDGLTRSTRPGRILKHAETCNP